VFTLPVFWQDMKSYSVAQIYVAQSFKTRAKLIQVQICDRTASSERCFFLF
jgi:hypothetical protein